MHTVTVEVSKGKGEEGGFRSLVLVLPGGTYRKRHSVQAAVAGHRQTSPRAPELALFPDKAKPSLDSVGPQQQQNMTSSDPFRPALSLHIDHGAVQLSAHSRMRDSTNEIRKRVCRNQSFLNVNVITSASPNSINMLL